MKHGCMSSGSSIKYVRTEGGVSTDAYALFTRFRATVYVIFEIIIKGIYLIINLILLLNITYLHKMERFTNYVLYLSYFKTHRVRAYSRWVGVGGG